jgi:hypothetical protein
MSCKNTRSSAFSGNNLALSLAMVNPAVEKTLSEGAEVAGIQRILLAQRAKLGYKTSFYLHHANGLLNLSSTRKGSSGAALYFLNVG